MAAAGLNSTLLWNIAVNYTSKLQHQFYEKEEKRPWEMFQYCTQLHVQLISKYDKDTIIMLVRMAKQTRPMHIAFGPILMLYHPR